MSRLILVSLIWAFSFGLIAAHLANADASVVAMSRLALALLVFLPFFRFRKIPFQFAAAFTAIGVVQFGFMYIFYLAAFRSLAPHEVALFTIFTPLYVAQFDNLLEGRFEVRWLAASVLAVLGAAILIWETPVTLALWAESSTAGRLWLCVTTTFGGGKWHGFLLVQLSNACFAIGQIAYKRLRPRLPNVSERTLFAWAIAGGAIAAGVCAIATDANWRMLVAPVEEGGFTLTQWLVLIYLGTVASGLCFFWWNRGATQVDAGTLAVFNNLKIPLGVVCALLFFATPVPDIWKLIASFAIMLAAICVSSARKKT